MKNYKQKGFSLIEILVSMIVVSIAMLGFASLLAFGSRTVNKAFTNNLGTDIVQSTANLFQLNKFVLSNADWSSGDRIVLTSKKTSSSGSYILTAIKTENFQASLASLFDQVNGLVGVTDSAMQIELIRDLTKSEENAVVFENYIVTINLAYQTERNDKEIKQINEDDLLDYCPFRVAGSTSEEISSNISTLNSDRIKYSITCNSMEIRL